MVEAGRTTILDCAGIVPDRDGVFRYLGYPRGAVPQAGIQRQVDEVLEMWRASIRPRAGYAVYRVIAADRRTLKLETGATFSGLIGKYLREATRAAAFVATAGPEIAAQAREAAASHDTVAELIYNAAGSWLAEAAVERAVANLRRRIGPGEELTLRYSPGYCGMALDQQRLIFDLVDAAAVG